jgi:AmmeMemoRadiSam system protein B
MLRNPAVAGQFYAGDGPGLKAQVEQYVSVNRPKKDAIGIMVPHAGLIYSGAVAGSVYSSINFPKTFIMLGPNHTGLGSSIALMDDGEWKIPGAGVRIDRRLASRILQGSGIAQRDNNAHMFEHSLEVQLPFISYFSKDTEIVPISLMQASYDQCCLLAEDIAKAVQSVDYRVVILASSDMSHYLPDRAARRKDGMAIERITAMDHAGLFETVRRENISMCGMLPATVMLAASRLLGADHAEVVKYMTSGDVSGDYDKVVGYAGVIVH